MLPIRSQSKDLLMKAPLLASMFTLAACGSGAQVEAEDASVAEVQAKIKDAGGAPEMLTPGRWESTVRIEKVDIPGMPPELAERMKKAMAGRTSASCRTPEEAKKPAAEFFAGKDRQGCRYDHFRMGDGVLDARMTCAGQGGGATIAMKGDYTPESFRLAMNMDGQGIPNAPQGSMTMAMAVDSKRVGECTGQEG
jgi:hypothetical protein